MAVWLNLRASTFGLGRPAGSNASSGSAGVRLGDSIDPRYAGTGDFSNSVLRALQYCQGLFIEDPLVFGADLYQRTNGETRPVARQAVVAGAVSLVEIAPLVITGVVETFFTGSFTKADAEALAAVIKGSD